ncbi:MAG TPA: hypothetical protein VIT22_06950 [Pseudoxanthomonas sp.]
MNRVFHGPLCGFALFLPCVAMAADTASGSFRLGKQTIEPRHAIAVQAESEATPGETETWIYLSVSPFDPAPVAAAFGPDDAVRAQASDEVSGSYVKVCIDADGTECGLDFAHRGPTRNFSTGGYGELALTARTAQRIAGKLRLAEPEDFFEETYQFDLDFDVAITPAPGTDLPTGGGEPGTAYQVYLAALAQGDFATLRKLAGEEGAYRFPEDDPTSAKESLKLLRDEQPVSATISRGRANGDEAVLWVEGVDRDDINRQGRVLMKLAEREWRFEEAELEVVE